MVLVYDTQSQSGNICANLFQNPYNGKVIAQANKISHI